jgi:hypothetical protein
MGITEFLLELAKNPELQKQFAPGADPEEMQRLIDERGLSRDDQLLLSKRDLRSLRVKVNAEFPHDQMHTAAIWTIYSATGTIYIPPPPPPTEP